MILHEAPSKYKYLNWYYFISNQLNRSTVIILYLLMKCLSEEYSIEFNTGSTFSSERIKIDNHS
jgi:hypothetical protein